MSVGRLVVKGFNVLATGRVVGYLTQILVTMVLARIIAVEAFGVIAICSAVVAFGQVLSTVGLGPALVQRERLEQRHRDAAIAIAVLLSVLILGLAFLLSWPIADFFGIRSDLAVLQLVTLALPLGSLASVPTSLLQRDYRFRSLAAVEVVSYLIGYAAPAMMLAFLGAGVWALALGMLGQACVKLVWTLLLARAHCQLKLIGWKFDRAAVWDLAHFGIGYSVGSLASFVSLNGDNLVIGRLFIQSAVAYYSRAYQLIALPANLFGYALDAVLFPVMSRMQDNRIRLSSVYSSGVVIMAVVFMPLSGLIALTADALVLVVLGSQWRPSISLVVILSAFTFFRMAYKLTDAVTRALGIVGPRAALKIVYALLVVIGSWLGAGLSLEHVALFVGIAVGVHYLLMNVLVFRHIPFEGRSFLAAHLRGLVALAAVALLVFPVHLLVKQVLEAPPFVVLAVSWAAFGAAMGLLVLAAPRLLLGAETIGFITTSFPSSGLVGRVVKIIDRRHRRR